MKILMTSCGCSRLQALADCASDVGGGGRLEGTQRSPERSKLLAKGRLHPFLPLPWKL